MPPENTATLKSTLAFFCARLINNVATAKHDRLFYSLSWISENCWTVKSRKLAVCASYCETQSNVEDFTAHKKNTKLLTRDFYVLLQVVSMQCRKGSKLIAKEKKVNHSYCS